MMKRTRFLSCILVMILLLASAQAALADDFDGVDITAQIPETVIFDGNGLKITVHGLTYSVSRHPEVGIPMTIE